MGNDNNNKHNNNNIKKWQQQPQSVGLGFSAGMMEPVASPLFSMTAQALRCLYFSLASDVF